MAFTISYKFLANDSFSKVATKMAAKTETLRTKIDKVRNTSLKLNSVFARLKNTGSVTFAKLTQGSLILKSKLNTLKTSVKRVTEEFKKSIQVSKKFIDIGQEMSTKLTLPIVAAGTASLVASAKIETMTVSFESLLGSADAAQKMMEKLKKFSATTPFQLPGVAKSAKMLLSFGVAQEKIEERLRMIGDVAAAINAPMGDIALIFGQVKAKGKLMNEEILQLSERGVPILDVLAKGLGRTKAEVSDLASKSQISFDVFLKAFQKTRELKFMDQMEKQSATLAGKWSTLVDNIVLGAAKIGDILVSNFKVKEILDSAIASIQSATEWVSKFSQEHPTITKVALAFGAVLAAIGPVLIALGTLGIMASVASIGLGAISAGLAVLFSPITLIVAAIAGLVAAGIYLYNNWEMVINKLSSLWSDFKNYMSEVFEGIKTTTSEKFEGIKDAMLMPIMMAKEKILGFVTDVKSKFDGVKEFFSNTFGFGGTDSNLDVTKRTELTGEALVNNKSRSDVNINLNAPKGVVKDTSTKTSGYSNVNLGFNMVGVN